MWRVAANILNKKSRTADSGWILEVEWLSLLLRLQEVPGSCFGRMLAVIINVSVGLLTALRKMSGYYIKSGD
jgi:hypothetical protein